MLRKRFRESKRFSDPSRFPGVRGGFCAGARLLGNGRNLARGDITEKIRERIGMTGDRRAGHFRRRDRER
jgi:hypothetical protein